MNKPMMQTLLGSRKWIVAALAVTCVLSTGCEPLRKKFVRKKQQKEEAIPILDPVEYAGPRETVEGVYRYHYGLWQVWQRELITAFQENQSPSRMDYLCKEVLTQLAGMQSVLTPEKRSGIDSYVKMIENIKTKVMGPPAMRNDNGVVQELMRMDNVIRRDFNLKDVEGSFVKNESGDGKVR